MSKEYLEAFKIVYNNFDYLISDVGIENDDVNICLKTIKEQLPTIKQSLKALEIIKEKNVNIYWFKSELTLRNISYRYYVNNFGSFHNGLVVKLLDEEEFNLLKGILNDEQ